MEYMFSITDSHGYIHSIDNFICTYYVEDISLKSIDTIIEEIRLIKEKYPNVKYWEKLNVNPCRKYSFYQHAIHLDDGIYILLGHYKDYDKETKEVTVFPMIKLEINPNKHGKKEIFYDFMGIIEKYCYDCMINRYDYAIDIPLPPDKIKVFGTHKEQGLYKGTRYYGQRNKNGFCRIYDKAKEQELDTPLTRVEHVFSLTKTTKNISFEDIYIESDNFDITTDVISKTDKVIVDLCNLCKANKLNYEELLQGLDKRKRWRIELLLCKSGYVQLEFNHEIHNSLFKKVKDYFKVKNDVSADSDGILTVTSPCDEFMEVDESMELPFD